MTFSKIFFIALCIFAVLGLPWQIAVILSLIGLIIFDFKEIILIGFVMDLVYGYASPYFMRPAILVLALGFYFLAQYLKEKIIRKR